MPTCAVSVDLDALGCYHAIHGLSPPPAALADVILARALPRFAELFARRGVRATFFVVGADLRRDPAGRAALAALAAAGHELASHSLTHPYELARLAPARQRDELVGAHEALAELSGAAPVGFRAPGYGLSPALLGLLVELGYRYDSSLLPSPPYYLAKAAVMAALAATGRRSGAVLGDPRALFAPADPYRPELARPWRRGQAPLLELPIAVTPLARLPAIGTTLLAGPAPLRAHLLRAVSARPLFNLELHGIDLIDGVDDGLPPELIARQPDLRVALARKRHALEQALERLARTHRFARLVDVAAELEQTA